MSGGKKRGVLMVCLGNICRSPIAEAVFREEVKRRGLTAEWFVDSAGTCGFHVGSGPERRGRSTMEKHGIEYSHSARVLETEDFLKFHFILGMDNENVHDIHTQAPSDHTAVIQMLGDLDPVEKGVIRDPYYDRGSEGFESCYHRCLRCVKAFLDKH